MKTPKIILNCFPIFLPWCMKKQIVLKTTIHFLNIIIIIIKIYQNLYLKNKLNMVYQFL
jgi:hypothetical protein